MNFSEVCHFQTYEFGANEVVLPPGSCFSHYVIGMADAAFPSQSGYVEHWTPTPHHCQMLCQGDQDCVNFVWLWAGTGGTCFLKDAEMIKNDELQRFVHYDEYAVTGPAFCSGLVVLYGRGNHGLEGGRRWRETLEGQEEEYRANLAALAESADEGLQHVEGAEDEDYDRGAEHSFYHTHPGLAAIWHRFKSEHPHVRTVTINPRPLTTTSVPTTISTSGRAFTTPPSTSSTTSTTTHTSTSSSTTTTTTSTPNQNPPVTTTTTTAATTSTAACDLPCILAAYCASCNGCCEPQPRIEVTVYD